MIYPHQKMSMRNYKKERENYHSRPEQMLRNAARKRARRQMEKEGKALKGDGKDVHHKDNNPLNNDKNNLSLVTQHYNRREPRLREAVDVKKALSKVKGLTKKQIEFLQTLPDPALIQIVQQLSGLVMGEVKEYMEKWETENESLWANIRKRRAAGKPKKKPGDKGYPKTLDVGEDAVSRAKEREKLKDKHNREKEAEKRAIASTRNEDMGTVTGPAIAGTGDDSSTVVVRKKKLKDRVKMMARRR